MDGTGYDELAARRVLTVVNIRQVRNHKLCIPVALGRTCRQAEIGPRGHLQGL